MCLVLGHYVTDFILTPEFIIKYLMLTWRYTLIGTSPVVYYGWEENKTVANPLFQVQLIETASNWYGELIGDDASYVAKINTIDINKTTTDYPIKALYGQKYNSDLYFAYGEASNTILSGSEFQAYESFKPCPLSMPGFLTTSIVNVPASLTKLAETLNAPGIDLKD